MKRSEINNLIRECEEFLTKRQFILPPWASWSLQQWQECREEISEIRECMLGWDLTDFGSGNFSQVGLLLFTIRNGVLGHPRFGVKPYAEKILIVEENQVTPMHFHWHKMEDIINRGGGELLIQLYNSTPDDKLADTDVIVSIDGIQRRYKAGDVVTLTPGESIALPARLYHSFRGKPGKGKILLGEVSCVNDDNKDNRFYEPIGRFPAIEEDTAPTRLLFSDYAKVIRKA